MLKTIKLYGHLGQQFGKVHRLDVCNAVDAIRALSALYCGFHRSLLEHQLGYRIIVDNAPICVRDELALPGRTEIKIVPLISGAGSGVGKIFMGIALVVAAIYMPALLPTLGASTAVATAVGNMAFAFGACLVLGGISQMLAKTPTSTKPNDSTSYLFNGPTNTVSQGNSIPILYGRLIIGSQVVSASMQAYDIALTTDAETTLNQVTIKGVT